MTPKITVEGVLFAVNEVLRGLFVQGAAVINLVAPSSHIVVPVYPYCDRPLAVVDTSGKPKIGPDFFEIQYLGNGIYQTRGVYPPFEGIRTTEKMSIYNRDGQQLSTKVPPDATFAGVYYLGTMNNETKKTTLTVLPDDALLAFRESNGGKLGLCDMTGTEVVPASFSTIDSVNGGRPLMFKTGLSSTYPDREHTMSSEEMRAYKSQHVFYYEPIAKELREIEELSDVCAIAREYTDGMRAFCSRRERGLHGFLDKNGKIAISAKYRRYIPFENGRAIVTQKSSSKYGDRYVIDKSGKRISPKGKFIRLEWNDVYLVGLGGPSGLMDRDFKWKVKPAMVHISPRRDGTFFRSDLKSQNHQIVTKYGTVRTLSHREMRPIPMVVRCVPKTGESQPSSDEFFACSMTKIDRLGLRCFREQNYRDPVQSGSSKPEPFRPIDPTLASRLAPYEPLVECEQERLIAQAPLDINPLDPKAWQRFNRMLLFASFLKNAELIGVSKDEARSLFGARHVSYADHPDDDVMLIDLISGGCVVDSYIFVELHFKNGKVQSWNFMDGSNQRSNSVEQSVVLEVLPLDAASK